jgi:4-hydroxy-tetrahydrodipicolinate synthase
VSAPAPWEGVFPSLPTPFAEDGAIDLAGARRVTRFAVDAGAHGLLCLGLAGEVWKLDLAERLELVRAIVAETAGAVPVLAGAGTETVAATVELARAMLAAGAAGVVIPTPVGAPLDGEAAGVDGPLVLQHAPAYLGSRLTPATAAAIAEANENVRLVKLEAGPAAIAVWRATLPGRVGVFGGDGGLYLVDAIEAGAAGIAPGAEVTDLLVAAYATLRAGGPASARRLLAPVLPLIAFEMESIDHYVACAKHVLHVRGVLGTTARRAPATILAPAIRAILDEHVRELGFGLSDIS